MRIATQIYRASSLIRNLRTQGDVALADRVKRLVDSCSPCTTHGKLADPIVALVSDGLSVICPHCQPAHVQKAWEAEGKKHEDQVNKTS